jgi:uncharacterized Fe-S cluster-containing radical SAM superfamily protein
MLEKSKAIKVDEFGSYLRDMLIDKDNQTILISDLRSSEQSTDIHNINCEGYGRVWHKSIESEPSWGEIVLPYYPAAWKLGISRAEASIIQVFQTAGCNYRCWFCYVDYKLLKADLKRSKRFSASDIVNLLTKESFIPKVIRLSGGQPDLTPEWTIWMMRALINEGIHKSTYLWLDDNLSNDYAWRYLSDEDWELMLNYSNFGRVGCLKGFDDTSFNFNTHAPSEHFSRQLDILSRLVKTGLDVYVYLVMTTPSLDKVGDKIEILLDKLQKIHPNLPLRVSPLKIKPYTPTSSRMNTTEALSMEQNQYHVLNTWKESLHRRYSSDQLAIPCYEAHLA